MKHNYLTIIPARKNSLRLKNKNIKLFKKKPMIEHTFELAKKVKKLDFVILSSNDNKILKLARKKNILTPFKRPEKFSKQGSKISDVILHALRWYKKKYKFYPDNIVLLQPTSPLREANEIKKAINYYEKINCNSMVSAADPFQNPRDLYYFNNSNKLINPIIKKNTLNRKQGKIYFIDGGFFICKVKFFLNNKKLVNNQTKLFIIKKEHAFDIDDKFDHNLAESYSYFNQNTK